jgi:GTP-dependent phosphoenolpyruvate carboxykinase
MVSAAERWVADQERLAKPARVYWCDGSDGEAWRLLEKIGRAHV